MASMAGGGGGGGKTGGSIKKPPSRYTPKPPITGVGKKPSGSITDVLLPGVKTGLGIGGGSKKKKGGTVSKGGNRSGGVAKRGGSIGTVVRDVYPNGGSGGGGGGSRGGGRPYGGGYVGRGSRRMTMDQYRANQAAQYRGPTADQIAQKQFDLQEAARKKELEEQRKKQKEAAKLALDQQLKLIDSAMDNARGNYNLDRADWTDREGRAVSEIDEAYGLLRGDTEEQNELTNSALLQHQIAAAEGGQSLVDAISGRNKETTEGLSSSLNQMGLGKALGNEQTKASESMALAEMQARGNQAGSTADYGLIRGAQQAIGNWNVAGQGSDQQEMIHDTRRTTHGNIRELQDALRKLLQEQEMQKTEAGNMYRDTIAGIL